MFENMNEMPQYWFEAAMMMVVVVVVVVMMITIFPIPRVSRYHINIDYTGNYDSSNIPHAPHILPCTAPAQLIKRVHHRAHLVRLRLHFL